MAKKAKALKPGNKRGTAKSAKAKISKAKTSKTKAAKPKPPKAKAAKAKVVTAKPVNTKSAKPKPVKATLPKAKRVIIKSVSFNSVQSRRSKPAIVMAPAMPQSRKPVTSTPAIAWPVKTREMHNHHMNSTLWNDFKFRDDDIVIATYAKSGTTWMQQIVGQLIFNGAEGVNVPQLSPWVDLRIMPPEVIAGLEHQTHRRFVKTHLPVDALVFSPKAKYIYIGRDGRDAVWSMYNHHVNANEKWYAALNTTPGRVGPAIKPPPASVHKYYTQWMAGDGYPFWSFWGNVRSWWGVRELPNVKLIHFNDMKADLAGTVQQIADFLDIKVDAASLSKIVEHCTFDYMKAHAELAAPLGGAMWNGGAQTFINKGTNGRWHDTLSAAEVATYEAKAVRKLGPECATWLAQGKAA